MATATKSVTELKPAIPAVVETVYNLTLTQKEAKFLRDLLGGHVSGTLASATSIYNALMSTGFSIDFDTNLTGTVREIL